MCVTRVIEIQSDEGIPIDENFKVSAGPGAGKTHWLVLHIKNILRNSNKLGKTARIACITYTNTGVDEIRGRLGNSIEGVEVSTIHSFLYKNVVRPFGFLLIDNENRPIINLKELDGHDEHIPSRDVIRRWKENTGQQYLQDDKKIYNCLIDLDWKFDDADQLSLHPRKPWLNRIHNGSIGKRRRCQEQRE